MAKKEETLGERIERERGFRPAWALDDLINHDAVYVRLTHETLVRAMEDESILPRKFKELIIIAVDTVSYPVGVKTHMRQAFKAGASVAEILEALKAATIPGGVHVLSVSLRPLAELVAELGLDNEAASREGVPESDAAGVTEQGPELAARIEADRGFRPGWAQDQMLDYDSTYAQLLHGTWMRAMRNRPAMSRKMKELIIIAVDSVIYRDGVKIHIKNALKAGATKAEILECLRVAAIPGGIHVFPAALKALQELEMEQG